jgi:hypothetical protein
MALRRLLSGWLIAMAALARSVAQALERASEDRSTVAPDPVMTALAERYPGAPAHWLAHVAERTSQLAEVGERPASLNSDPSAWPPVPSDEPSPRLAMSAEREAVPREPRVPPPPPTGRDAAVPTLAAQRDRSSEVWRPDGERKRRPRPVFAPLKVDPTSARPPSRPRSPLTFVGSPSQAVSSAPEPAAPASEGPVSRTPPHEPVRSEASPPRPATADTATVQPVVRAATERSAIDHAFTQTRPKDVSDNLPQTRSGRIGATSPARRQRSWFFARPAPARVERTLELSADSGGSARGETVAGAETVGVDPGSAPRAAFPFTAPGRQVVAPDRARTAETPPTSRPSLFQALAGLGSRPRPRVDHLQPSEPTVAKTSPPAVRPVADSGPRRSATVLSSSRAAPSVSTAATFSHIAPATNPAGSSGGTKVEPSLPAGRRIAREALDAPAPDGGARLPSRQPGFSTHPAAASRDALRGFVDSPPADRWPALPPATMAPPLGIEAPPPRWDRLAREQEEGRWSA